MRMPLAIDHMRRNEGRINASFLHFMDFVGDPMYVWMGTGEIATYDGVRWQGIGYPVGIDWSGQQLGVVASSLQLTISAGEDVLSDSMIQKTVNSEALVKGRRYFMALQYFDENWQPVDRFDVKFIGVMDRLTYERDSDTRTLTLSVESPFARRKTPRLEQFSSVDQRARYPNDGLLDYMSMLGDKTVTWLQY